MSSTQIQAIKDAASAANQQFQSLAEGVPGGDSLAQPLNDVVSALGKLFTESDARFVAATQNPTPGAQSLA